MGFKMICPYCESTMQDFTESFVCCFNDDCPHRSLPVNQRKGYGSRSYGCRREAIQMPSKTHVEMKK